MPAVDRGVEGMERGVKRGGPYRQANNLSSQNKKSSCSSSERSGIGGIFPLSEGFSFFSKSFIVASTVVRRSSLRIVFTAR